jgi:hypothetical protein
MALNACGFGQRQPAGVDDVLMPVKVFASVPVSRQGAEAELGQAAVEGAVPFDAWSA